LQRWCCGDQQHVDLGRAAFAQLAPEEQGVIGLRWREVSCDTQGNPGTSPAGTTDTPQQPQQQQPQDAGNSNDSQGWWDGATKSWKNAPGMSWDNLLQKWTKQGSADNSQQQPQEQQPSDSGSSNSQGWWDDASKSWKNLPGMVWSNLQQKWVNQGSDSNQGSGGGMQGGSWAPGQLLGQVARQVPDDWFACWCHSVWVPAVDSCHSALHTPALLNAAVCCPCRARFIGQQLSMWHAPCSHTPSQPWRQLLLTPAVVCCPLCLLLPGTLAAGATEAVPQTTACCWQRHPRCTTLRAVLRLPQTSPANHTSGYARTDAYSL
jgi:hypothetical protein